MVFRSLGALRVLLSSVVLALSAGLHAQENCRLCYSSGPTVAGEKPLEIEISADLVFNKMALTGDSGGSAVLDPSGEGHSADGGMVDLGGLAVSGHGRITGTPGREVRLNLPSQVAMTAAAAGNAELVDFKTDLPPRPRLSASGSLEFSFGARLVVHGQQGGSYHAQIPISVDYN